MILSSSTPAWNTRERGYKRAWEDGGAPLLRFPRRFSVPTLSRLLARSLFRSDWGEPRIFGTTLHPLYPVLSGYDRLAIYLQFWETSSGTIGMDFTSVFVMETLLIVACRLPFNLPRYLFIVANTCSITRLLGTVVLILVQETRMDRNRVKIFDDYLLYGLLRYKSSSTRWNLKNSWEKDRGSRPISINVGDIITKKRPSLEKSFFTGRNCKFIGIFDSAVVTYSTLRHRWFTIDRAANFSTHSFAFPNPVTTCKILPESSIDQNANSLDLARYRVKRRRRRRRGLPRPDLFPFEILKPSVWNRSRLSLPCIRAFHKENKLHPV